MGLSILICDPNLFHSSSFRNSQIILNFFMLKLYYQCLLAMYVVHFFIYVRNCACGCWLPPAPSLSSHAQIHNMSDGTGRCTSCSVNTRCELCMCRRVGHLSQVATANCGSLGSSVWNVRGCALRLLVLEWYFVQTMRILHITTSFTVIFFICLQKSKNKLSEAMISMVGPFATMLSYSELESQNITVH